MGNSLISCEWRPVKLHTILKGERPGVSLYHLKALPATQFFNYYYISTG